MYIQCLINLYLYRATVFQFYINQKTFIVSHFTEERTRSKAKLLADC